MNARTVFAFAALVITVSACGPAGAVGTEPAPPVGPDAEAPPTAAATLAAASTAAVDSAYGDVSSYVACEIVTPQEVADLVGGPLFRDLEQPMAPTCTYEVVAGPTDYMQFTAFIEPAEWVQALIENAPETLGDPVAGIGDIAYLSHDESTGLYRLLVLVQGRVGLEVAGDDADAVRGIGELFLSRMVGP